MKNNVTIDVVIPVFNGASYIQEALDSVVQQTCSPTRIIVVNDGSTDDTAEIVESIAATCKIPLLHIQKKNGGLSSARNAGIRISASDYIAFLDADDVWVEDKLAWQLALFTSSFDKTLGIVYGRYSLIDEHGHEIREPYYNPDVCLSGHVFSDLLGSNKICGSGSAVLIKRECFDYVGYFDESLGAAEDWDMWLRLAEMYTFNYVDRVIVRIRRHGASMQQNQKIFFLNQLAFYRKWSFKLPERNCAGNEWAMFLVNRFLHSIRHIYFNPIFVTEILLMSKDEKRKIFWKSHNSFFLSVWGRVVEILLHKWNKYQETV